MTISNKLNNFLCELAKDFQPHTLIDTLFESIISKRIEALDARKNFEINKSEKDDDGIRKPGFNTFKCELVKKLSNYSVQFVVIVGLTLINIALGSLVNQIPNSIRKKEPKEEKTKCNTKCEEE